MNIQREKTKFYNVYMLLISDASGTTVSENIIFKRFNPKNKLKNQEKFFHTSKRVK